MKKSETKIKVLVSAIWYNDGKKHPHQPFNIETGFVILGLRHHNVMAIPWILGSNLKGVPQVQGFLTDVNEFVNREEAAEYAIAAGQVNEEELHVAGKLFSEDLY